MSVANESSAGAFTDGEELDPLEQVRIAYSDTGKQRDLDTYNFEDRALKFLTSEWFAHREPDLEGTDLAKTIRTIGSYNSFDLERVIDHLEECVAANDNPFKEGTDQDPLRVAVGREGSPVLYIETDEPEKIKARLSGYADECWKVDHDKVGNARGYMNNGDTEVDILQYSQRDAFLVHPLNFAEPQESRHVIRAWWD